MSVKYGSMRNAGQPLENVVGAVQSPPDRPHTQRGIPRVAVAPPTPTPARRENTEPQTPRLARRLKAVTPLPRDTLPFEMNQEATLSYDGRALFGGLDFDDRRQQTMPLTPSELERLGGPSVQDRRRTQPNQPVGRGPHPHAHPNDDSETGQHQRPAAKVIQLRPQTGTYPSLPDSGPQHVGPHRHPMAFAVDLDLGRARHDNDPARQSALLELSGLSKPNYVPWLFAGIGMGLGVFGLCFAFL